MDPSRYHPPNEVEATSTRLLHRAALGESGAWELIVSLYGPVVRYWLRGAGLGHPDRADVFQDVFLAVAQNLPRFEREPGEGKFRAWLKSVTRSKVSDHFRKHERQPVAVGGSTAHFRLGELPASPQIEPEHNDPALEHSEETFLAQRVLQNLRSEFQESTWRAFQLTAIDGLTSQQAAVETGLSPLAVRKAKSRVMQRLRSALAELDQPAVSSPPGVIGL